MAARFDQPSVQDAAALLTFGAGLGLLHLHYRITGRTSWTARALTALVGRLGAACERHHHYL